MGDGVLAINLLFHHTILVNTNGSEDIKHALVHGLKTIYNQRYSDLLPCGIAFLSRLSPELALFGIAHVTNIEHDTMQGTSVERFVLVV